ncbi:hypothetical protein A1Q2_00018 [Trichosporon asahii var. asahii CBS 8904]|uniref:Dynactin subunit 5 n=1 Tax=Trichosporon asahii var. asahii (strain CBS 8904) TaxID=1220162 RepID=K1W1N9_TRIAC|nr:hypothetical protein A1Q2_00018 [Trichosporon asahii var. asahii CBS 8904]
MKLPPEARHRDARIRHVARSCCRLSKLHSRKVSRGSDVVAVQEQRPAQDAADMPCALRVPPETLGSRLQTVSRTKWEKEGEHTMGAFDPPILFEKGTYIDKVSRKAFIQGATNIVLHGKSIIQTRAILRGDLRRSTPNNAHHVVLSLGKYCLVGEGAVLRPPGKIYKGTFTFYPVRIGDCVHIGPDAIVEAASVGHGVEIGARAIVPPWFPEAHLQGKFAILKDYAVILPDAVLPDGAVVPSYTVWGGNPARLVDTLPETYQETVEERSCQSGKAAGGKNGARAEDEMRSSQEGTRYPAL